MRVKTGPRRAFEGMTTTTTLAQHEALLRDLLDDLRRSYDHYNEEGGGLRSSRSLLLSVRQELGIDGPWEAIFDLMLVRVATSRTHRKPAEARRRNHAAITPVSAPMAVPVAPVNPESPPTYALRLEGTLRREVEP